MDRKYEHFYVLDEKQDESYAMCMDKNTFSASTAFRTSITPGCMSHFSPSPCDGIIW